MTAGQSPKRLGLAQDFIASSKGRPRESRTARRPFWAGSARRGARIVQLGRVDVVVVAAQEHADTLGVEVLGLDDPECSGEVVVENLAVGDATEIRLVFVRRRTVARGGVTTRGTGGAKLPSSAV